MNNKTTDKFAAVGTFVGIAVLALMLLIHALAVFPGVSAIRWFFQGTATVLGRLDAPAWVQAIGSILAIVAAGAIAGWQARESRLEARRNRKRSDTDRALAVSYLLRRAILVVENTQNAIGSKSRGSMNLAREQVEMVQQALRALPVFEIPSPRLVFDLQRVDRDLLYVLRLLAEVIEPEPGKKERTGRALFVRVHRRLREAMYACVTIMDPESVGQAHLTGIGPLNDEDDITRE
ncbi:hypothetical protein [Variovorax boronicumulans]